MSTDQLAEPVALPAQQGACALHGPHRRLDVTGPWLSFLEAAAYVRCLHRCGCPSAKAFYNWRLRHDVIAQGNVVAKADLDRAIRAKARVVRHGR